jgi:hypothetical protein
MGSGEVERVLRVVDKQRSPPPPQPQQQPTQPQPPPPQQSTRRFAAKRSARAARSSVLSPSPANSDSPQPSRAPTNSHALKKSWFLDPCSRGSELAQGLVTREAGERYRELGRSGRGKVGVLPVQPHTGGAPTCSNMARLLLERARPRAHVKNTVLPLAAHAIYCVGLRGH